MNNVPVHTKITYLQIADRLILVPRIQGNTYNRIKIVGAFHSTFPEISRGEWNSIIHSFRKRVLTRDFRKFISGNVRSL